MNRKYVFLTALCVLLAVSAGFSQDKKTAKDYSGSWTLDVKKSELGERSRIESMTMTVTQTETELSFERKAKLAERQDDGGGGGRGGFGGRGGGFGGGDMAFTYDLSGRETTVETGQGQFAGEAKLKAKSEKDGKLKLTQTRNFEGPMGSVSIKTTETWEISEDGKTLTVTSETETPRGNRTSKMVFVKSTAAEAIKADPGAAAENAADMKSVKKISGGVVNGKALSLPVPVYPAEAKEQGVSGVVNVRVLIDFDGNVAEASALSGPDALREAAVEAAKQSKFAPMLLEGNPVQVEGVIVYNFKAK